MALVVAASVAVKWLVVEEDSADARALLDQVDRGAAGQLLATMSDLPVRWHVDETICADAIRLAIADDRPVYDLMYLALAQRLGVRVVTADQRLVNALASTDHGDLVVPLTDPTGDG